MRQKHDTFSNVGSDLNMSVNKPVEFKVLVIVPEGVDELLRHLEQAHVEEELEHSENRNVEINVERDAAASHRLMHVVVVNLLAADDGEDEEDVGGQGHHLETIVYRLCDQGRQLQRVH